jgi:hypothetical protein
LFSFPRSAVRHSAMQGVRRPREGLRVVNLSKYLEDYCYRSAQSQVTSALRHFEDFSQGVRATSSHKDL